MKTIKALKRIRKRVEQRRVGAERAMHPAGDGDPWNQEEWEAEGRAAAYCAVLNMLDAEIEAMRRKRENEQGAQED